MTDKLFFALIGVALGHRESLGRVPTSGEWEEIYRQARRQTLAGVLFAGIERLPAEERPARELLLQWYALAQRIRQTNERLDREAVRVCATLEREGFGTVLLKGQGVAAAYPDPAARTPGDIDVWVVRDGGKGFPKGNFRAVAEYARRLDPKAPIQLLHTDFRLSDLTEVEAHFWPSYSFSPFRLRRIRRWATRQLPAQLAHRTPLPGAKEGTVCTPTARFNAVFLLLHIYRHLFHEGIGLRQLLDYHHCLQSPDVTAEVLEAVRRDLRRLGLWRFARAAAYVLHTAFGTDPDRLPAPPARREGRFLLREVMLAGNFGQHDPRMGDRTAEKPWKGYLLRLRWNLRLLAHYPGEAAWAPAFRCWHMVWRKWNGYA